MESDKEDLLELGQSRAKNIQGYLSQNYGIDPSRILICDPERVTSKDAKPLVLLHL